MIIEFISILIVFISGFTFLYSLGIRGYSTIPLGFIIGLSMQIIIGGFQIITTISTTPILTLLIILALPFIWLLCVKNSYKIDRDGISRFCLHLSIIFIVVSISIIFFFNEGWVKWSYDSLRYILSSKIFYDNRISILSEDLLTKRLFGVPVVHMPAQMSGENYLRSVFPLLGITTVTSFMFFVKLSLKKHLSSKKIWVLVIIGGLLLVSNNRFIWNWFYLNNHLICAALVMVMSACGWLIIHDKESYSKCFFPLIIIVIPALIFTRPESVIIASVAIIPMIFSEIFSQKQKMILLTCLGSSTTTFYGYTFFLLGGDFRQPHTLYLLYGILVICIAFIFRYIYKLKILSFLVKRATGITEIFIWTVLILFFLLNPQVMIISLKATYENIVLGEGLWGLSLVTLSVIIIITVILIKLPENISILRLPVTSFLPIMFLLPYLRGGAYRVGAGDSLNRMLVQIIPLTVYFLVVLIGLGKPRFARSKVNETYYSNPMLQ